MKKSLTIAFNGSRRSPGDGLVDYSGLQSWCAYAPSPAPGGCALPRKSRFARPALGQRRLPLSACVALFVLVASSLALRAQDATSPGTPAPAPAAASDNDPASHQGYTPDRYQELWTKSAFSVETPDQVVTDSADYTLVGVAQVGDVTYASLVQTQNQAHLLVSSDRPLGGLSLTSLSNKSDGVYVSFTRNGEPLTLKLQAAPAGVAAAQPPPNGGPGITPVFNPGGNGASAWPSTSAPSPRPLIHIRRPLIHLPPRLPGQPNPPPGAIPGQ